MQDNLKDNLDRTDDEYLKKHYLIFFALINPMFILHQISQNDNIIQLIENDKFSIELTDAELIIEIYHENLIL